MDKYEVFVKALFRIEDELCKQFGARDLCETSGVDSEFCQRYYGARTMLEVMSDGEIEATIKADLNSKEIFP